MSDVSRHGPHLVCLFAALTRRGREVHAATGTNSFRCVTHVVRAGCRGTHRGGRGGLSTLLAEDRRHARVETRVVTVGDRVAGARRKPRLPRHRRFRRDVCFLARLVR